MMEFTCTWDSKVMIITSICVAVCLLISLMFIVVLGKRLRKEVMNKFLVIGAIIIAMIPILILVVTFLFMPLKLYSEKDKVVIKQVKGEILLSVDNIIKIHRYIKPQDDKGIRKFASGGVFGFLGIFENQTLGEYQMYVTNTSDMIQINTRDGIYIVSCEHQDAFIESVSNNMHAK